MHAVCFSEIPPYLGLPSIHGDDWEPFLRACAETHTTVCMHIGSSSKMPSTSTDAPAAVGSTLTFGNAMSSLADWLFSGWLVRLPELRIAYSEGQIGWIPYILERADKVWEQNRAWGGVADKVPEPPSSYYYRQVYGCFFDDEHGLDSLDKVGVDNITFETDYPHSDSTWPHTLEMAKKMMAGIDRSRSARSSAATPSACCHSTPALTRRVGRAVRFERVRHRRRRDRCRRQSSGVGGRPADCGEAEHDAETPPRIGQIGQK